MPISVLGVYTKLKENFGRNIATVSTSGAITGAAMGLMLGKLSTLFSIVYSPQTDALFLTDLHRRSYSL